MGGEGADCPIKVMFRAHLGVQLLNSTDNCSPSSEFRLHTVKMTSFRCQVLLLLAVVLTACRAANVLHFESNPDDVVCPSDGAVCRSQSGEKSCCPFKDGQCCSDGAHCCPPSTVCDVTRSACLPTNSTKNPVSWPAVRRVQQAQSDQPNAKMTCPDKTSQCGTGAACCQDAIGRYACCTYPTNVCCDDGVHCCHSGTICDSLRGVCIPYPAGEFLSMTKTTPVKNTDMMTAMATSRDEAQVPVAAVVADSASKDEQSKDAVGTVNGYCPDGTICSGTCCLQSVSPLRYGCCPYVLATCCPGGRTCCSYGYRCYGSSCIRIQ